MQLENKPMKVSVNHNLNADWATLEKTFSGLSSLQKLMLLRRLGCNSFSSVLAASTVATLFDGSAWWLTADPYGV